MAEWGVLGHEPRRAPVEVLVPGGAPRELDRRYRPSGRGVLWREFLGVRQETRPRFKAAMSTLSRRRDGLRRSQQTRPRGLLADGCAPPAAQARGACGDAIATLRLPPPHRRRRPSRSVAIALPSGAKELSGQNTANPVHLSMILDTTTGDMLWFNSKSLMTEETWPWQRSERAW